MMCAKALLLFYRLQKNYVHNDTVCLPCDSLYLHVKKFCQAVGIPRISASHFGRVRYLLSRLEAFSL